MRWYRLCVDLTPRGNVKGASYEVHDESGLVSYGTVLVGPFDTVDEAIRTAGTEVIDRFGDQLQLPL